MATGGSGGIVSATFSVTAGQVFQAVVGGAGSRWEDGLNGGGTGESAGGGASDVRVCADAAFKPCGIEDRIVVAGGGGGTVGQSTGGAGGGLVGGGGSYGGTQAAGGSGSSGTEGTFGAGGDCDPGSLREFIGCGGGGGGWYGGAATSTSGVPGGGGSGYISPLAVAGGMTSGAWSAGDGKVIIYKD